jgi:hypothetical protein
MPLILWIKAPTIGFPSPSQENFFGITKRYFGRDALVLS